MRKAALSCVLGLLTCASARAGQPSSFDVVLQHYEPIRLALIADSTAGVAEHGRAIVTELRALQADLSPERAGVSHQVMPVVKEKLPAMIAAAEKLAAADSLQTARDAFYQLSVPLVRWQEGADEGRRPSVAYCPMYRRSWLQPGEEIGNPYGGMPRCGKIVSR
jgi:hypothetical protein